MKHDHQFQEAIEQTFSKNQLIPRLKQYFRDLGPLSEAMRLNQIPESFGIELLVQIALHRRANVSTLVGLLRHHFNGPRASQQAADMLLKAAECDLVNWFDEADCFVVIWEIPAQLQADLDRFQYPLPMVVEPIEVRTNGDSGYITHRSGIMLGGHHTDEDVCLDHINSMNQIKLKLNLETVHNTINKWKNSEKPKEGESFQDFKKRLKAFDKFASTTKDVISFLGMDFMDTTADNEFYLTHRYDFRGRTYAQGYQINYQGHDYNKAIIEFAEQELVEG